MISPWMIKLGGAVSAALTKGREKVAEYHRLGRTPDESVIQGILVAQLLEVDPKVNDQSIITDEARFHLSAALTKIAVAWMDAEAKAA